MFYCYGLNLRVTKIKKGSLPPLQIYCDIKIKHPKFHRYLAGHQHF